MYSVWVATLHTAAGAVAALCLAAIAAAAAEKSAAGSAAAAAPAGTPRFSIWEYVVDGNTVLSVTDVEEAVYPFLGESKTATDVDQARDALERAYQARGYQTVQVEIPKQGVEAGIIHLQVVENPVRRLRVVGAQYHSPALINEMAPSVAEGAVPNLGQLQHDMIALNQQPDMKVTPKLTPSSVPDALDVDLDVEDHLPLHGSLEINNQHNQDTTPLRAIGSLRYDNLWQLGHSLSLSYQVTPENPNDAKVLSANYLARVPDTPVSLLGYAVKSDSSVAALAGTDVVGRGYIFGARAIVNLPGGGDFYQSLTAGFDRKDLTQNVVTGGVPNNSPVLYYPATVGYTATKDPSGNTTQGDASVNFAVPGIGSSSPNFDAQRFQALRQYFYFKASLSHLQQLPLGLSVYAKAEGQITPDALLSSEQFSIGGVNSVRGYLEAERLGDYGGRGTIELRSAALGRALSRGIGDMTVFVFADGAAAFIREPLPDEQTSFGLASVGVGMRLAAFERLNASADVAIPLLDGAVTRAGSPSSNFRVWSEF